MYGAQGVIFILYGTMCTYGTRYFNLLLIITVITASPRNGHVGPNLKRQRSYDVIYPLRDLVFSCNVKKEIFQFCSQFDFV